MSAPAPQADVAAATRIADVRPFVFRAPVEVPVRTSFGTMHNRPMVLVRVEDSDGAVGWGEVWCNFPTCGAEHRARIVALLLKDLLVGKPAHDPARAFDDLTDASRIVALQSGEPGPFAQCIAGIDTALWDLAARRKGVALWRLLGGADPAIRVYASGLNPDEPERLAARKRAEGYTAFKLKIGFGATRDAANLDALYSELGPDTTLMVDANQAWDLATAADQAQRLADYRLAWLEEPLAADAGWDQWQELRRQTAIPLAAGENVAGDAAFDTALNAGALAVVQPDLAKWGGISRGLPLARRIRAAGLRYCPHFLGGGIGLLASAHLLAAVGGDGLLEIDANDNPLRTLLMGPLRHVAGGACRLGEEAGLGVVPDLSALRAFEVRY
jgi:D-galactarolactone cycloisomerase